MTWGTLGTLQFQVDEAPRSLRYREGTEYAEHPRIEGKPTIQKTAESLQTIDLSFRFGIGWCDPDEQLQRLQQARTDARPMPLVLGQGAFAGNYVIETIDVNVRQTDAEGRLEYIDVTVSLLETVDLPEPTEGTLFSRVRPFQLRA